MATERTRANMQSTITGNIVDNTTGIVTPADVRNDLLDLAESVVFPEDGVVADTDINYFEQEDWLITALFGFSSVASGTGAGLSSDNYGVDTTENAMGVLYLSTGTDTTGRNALEKNTFNDTFVFGIGSLKLRKRCSLRNLSDGTDTYTVYIGFGDNAGSGDMTDGAYFRYTHSVNSGKWEAVTAQGGTRTATDTTVTADTTYHIFEIRVNQAGTSVGFYIDGVLKATNTTNIPGAGQYTGHVLKIEKSAGTNARKVYEDWYDLLITRTSAR